jgi:hypothetical protein
MVIVLFIAIHYPGGLNIFEKNYSIDPFPGYRKWVSNACVFKDLSG